MWLWRENASHATGAGSRIYSNICNSLIADLTWLEVESWRSHWLILSRKNNNCVNLHVSSLLFLLQRISKLPEEWRRRFHLVRKFLMAWTSWAPPIAQIACGNCTLWWKQDSFDSSPPVTWWGISSATFGRLWMKVGKEVCCNSPTNPWLRYRVLFSLRIVNQVQTSTTTILSFSNF